MKKILLLGAGRSASSLIKYLLDNALVYDWQVTVADISIELALKKISGHPNGKALTFDVNNTDQRVTEITNTDIVISLLPAHLHHIVAGECVRHRKNMVTASYVSKEVKALDEDARRAGIVLLNEIGLDPGIDHMSAMRVIDQIKDAGGRIKLFKSYCGGLIAPESNDNPWGYKFTWNPRNVVLAGQGTAQYIERGKYRYIPYNRLFTQTETILIPGHGKFEAYANRDSLSYREPYKLQDIPTLLRGTLRLPGYCRTWNVFVKLGWTDDTYQVMDSEKLSYRELLDAYLPKNNSSLKQRLADFLQLEIDSEVINKLEWLGIFEDKPIKLKKATPAQILQSLLEEKWKLKNNDKDMIVMHHRFEYTQAGKEKCVLSSMVVKGDDTTYTAMAKTVGLPVGIAVKLVLENKINATGVHIPVTNTFYEPILNELKTYGIIFHEKEK